MPGMAGITSHASRSPGDEYTETMRENRELAEEVSFTETRS